MATYNAAMNRDLFAAAALLDGPARDQDRGAFWGSIRGTLSHLLWGDHMWMMRFDGWEPPGVDLVNSGAWFTDFDGLTHERRTTDERLIAWAERVTAGWLAKDLSWSSRATGRDYTYPHGFLVMHMFNHQTHHRGQVHAMLTSAGAVPGDTDLPFVVEPVVDIG